VPKKRVALLNDFCAFQHCFEDFWFQLCYQGLREIPRKVNKGSTQWYSTLLIRTLRVCPDFNKVFFVHNFVIILKLNWVVSYNFKQDKRSHSNWSSIQFWVAILGSKSSHSFYILIQPTEKSSFLRDTLLLQEMCNFCSKLDY
jgi:hypothetical protein